MSKTITIHDIARKAGVSPSTVSRVLSGNTPVTEAKRAAVMAIVNQLNYRPSPLAQGLKSGRAAAIGVLTQSVSSPYYGEILLGIERGLAGSDFHSVIASGNWRTEEEIEALDILAARRVDALIVLGGHTPDEHLRSLASRVPMVVLGRTVAGIERQCLRVDDERGAYEATRYLIALGHRRIVHISGRATHQDARDRKQGYLRALREADIPADPQLIIEGDYTEQSGLLATQAMLGRATLFSAIFAANDQMAYGARLALFRRGIRVPEDVSLVGFDDMPVSAYTTPPLTTIRQPAYDMGLAAAHAVLRLIDDEPLEFRTFATELMIRESAIMLR